jgi:hypothetical protein
VPAGVLHVKVEFVSTSTSWQTKVLVPNTTTGSSAVVPKFPPSITMVVPPRVGQSDFPSAPGQPVTCEPQPHHRNTHHNDSQTPDQLQQKRGVAATSLPQ